MADPVLPTDPVEEHFAFAGPIFPGEHLPVVGQHPVGNAMAAHRFSEGVTHRPSRRPDDHLGADTESRVVIYPGHHRRLRPISQVDPAGDVLGVDPIRRTGSMRGQAAWAAGLWL